MSNVDHTKKKSSKLNPKTRKIDWSATISDNQVGINVEKQKK